MKNLIQADAVNETAEEASSVDGNATIEDNRIIKIPAKQKERAGHRKWQRAAKKWEFEQPNEADKLLYCTILCEPLDGSRQENVGCI